MALHNTGPENTYSSSCRNNWSPDSEKGDKGCLPRNPILPETKIPPLWAKAAGQLTVKFYGISTLQMLISVKLA